MLMQVHHTMLCKFNGLCMLMQVHHTMLCKFMQVHHDMICKFNMFIICKFIMYVMPSSLFTPFMRYDEYVSDRMTLGGGGLGKLKKQKKKRLGIYLLI